MNAAAQAAAGRAPGERRPSIKLGVLLAIASEGMIFAGLVSGYLVFRTGATDWPPLGQPRLPVVSTAFNTFLLLLSAPATWFALSRVRRGLSPTLALGATAGLGCAFLLLQGREWASLLALGLGIQSNPFGAFFYTIVGTHALHVIVAVGLCLTVFLRAAAGRYRADSMDGLVAFSYFWYFVVGLWPPLYALVYLWQ